MLEHIQLGQLVHCRDPVEDADGRFGRLLPSVENANVCPGKVQSGIGASNKDEYQGERHGRYKSDDDGGKQLRNRSRAITRSTALSLEKKAILATKFVESHQARQGDIIARFEA